MDKNIISKAINMWDPVDLLSIHTPQDEYDAEIQKIYQWCISNVLDTNDLAKEIYNIFTTSFGVNVFFKDMNACMNIALFIVNNANNGNGS